MLASTDMVGFLLTKDYEKARCFLRGQSGIRVCEPGPVCAGDAGGQEHDPDREGSDVYAAAEHGAGLAGGRHRSESWIG